MKLTLYPLTAAQPTLVNVSVDGAVKNSTWAVFMGHVAAFLSSLFAPAEHEHTTADLPLATQADAEAGTASNVLMTPERTAQAIAEQSPTPTWGTLADKPAALCLISMSADNTHAELRTLNGALFCKVIASID